MMELRVEVCRMRKKQKAKLVRAQTDHEPTKAMSSDNEYVA
jgi:hypothetical protein